MEKNSLDPDECLKGTNKRRARTGHNFRLRHPMSLFQGRATKVGLSKNLTSDYSASARYESDEKTCLISRRIELGQPQSVCRRRTCKELRTKGDSQGILSDNDLRWSRMNERSKETCSQHLPEPSHLQKTMRRWYLPQNHPEIFAPGCRVGWRSGVRHCILQTTPTTDASSTGTLLSPRGMSKHEIGHH